MFAIAINYLTGRVVATAFNDREATEWPPHPARLFSALVCAWAEAGMDGEEGKALEWLESQAAPSVYASDGDERPVRTTYVPVNDPRGDSVLPDRRSRQPRAFPSFTPLEATAYAIWRDAKPDERLRIPLQRLLHRVSYLGHSSSLVSLWLVENPPAATHVPVDSGGELVLRVPAAGQLEALERAYTVYCSTGVRGQLPCRFQSYARARPLEGRLVWQGVFGDMVVLRRAEGPRLPIEAAELLASTLRKAVISASEEPVPEILSGHRADGSKSESPHVAFVALPAVGHAHADGQLLGAAAVLPAHLEETGQSAVHRALSEITRLTLGRAGSWAVEPATMEVPQRGLLPQTWSRPSRRWASVTPVELDAFPNEPYGEQAVEIIAACCSRTALPSPSRIVVGPDSIVPGAPPWHSFSQSRQQSDRPRRPLVHAVLDFEDPVRGPMLLGAGRYRGLGLCRPVQNAGG